MDFLPFDLNFLLGFTLSEIIFSLRARFACHQTSASLFGLLSEPYRSLEVAI